jgi:diamine N-acetyltransferase
VARGINSVQVLRRDGRWRIAGIIFHIEHSGLPIPPHYLASNVRRQNAPQPAPSAQSNVTLREITADTVRIICSLTVRDDQRGFVAPNAVSISQAHFADYAWFRAIYADESPVGFVMLQDQPEKPEYYLWRFMIDGQYQNMGFGRRAMEHLIKYVETRPRATELLTSVVQGEGGPQQFYEKLGFQLTGEYDGGEALMRLPL